MKTALVTGDVGFVGRHLVRELLHRGYAVVGVDVRDLKTIDAHFDAYTHITQDCRTFFTSSVSQPAWDLVFHCAAVIGGRLGIEENPLAVAEDIIIDMTFFRWLRTASVTHAVYYSSSAAYPIHLQDGRRLINLAESYVELPDDCRMPDMTYGWAKLTGEYVARFIQREHPDVSLHVLRPFSGYGSDQDLDYPFPAIMRRARLRENPLTVWHDTVRDFIHIDDIVAGTFAVIEANVTQPLNLCTGVATSFTELARLAAKYEQFRYPDSLYEPPITVIGGDMPRGVVRRVGDPFLLHGVYVPKITIEEGVRRALWTD